MAKFIEYFDVPILHSVPVTPSRQLAAILFTDIAGYTAMMQEDEAGALRVVRHYSSVLRDSVAKYQGTIVNDYGDGNLCTFTSVTEAVRCAVELQRKLQDEPKVPLRVGFHVGEIFFEGGKVFGDGVNVASRIQSLGVANSILFSSEIHSKISNQSEFMTVSLGSFHFKSVSAPMEVFALANDGLVVPERGSMDGKLKAQASPMKKWIAAGTLVLLVVAATFLYTKLYNQPDPEDLRNSVAVLAFDDLSPNQTEAWIADGVAYEIITALTNLKELKVTARTSSFYFKNKQVPVQEIGETLGVEHLVEGTVLRVGDQVKITVQLIQAKDGYYLWSESYEGNMPDVFEFQSNIAKQVAAKLIADFSPAQSSRLTIKEAASIEAYEFYMKGVQLNEGIVVTGQATDMDASEGNLLQAISIDPTYSLAYAALADLYDTKGNRPDVRTKYWRLRDSLSLVAYRLNPKSPQVLQMRSLIFRKSHMPQLDSAYFYLRRAYEADENSTNLWAGRFYSQIGLYSLGTEFYKKAIEVDPLNAPARRQLCGAQLLVGDWSWAEQEIDQLMRVDSLSGHLALMELYLITRQFDKAAKEIQILNFSPRAEARALLLAGMGRKQEALSLSRDIRILMMLGMKEESLHKLDSLTSLEVAYPFPVPANTLFGMEGLNRSPLWGFVRDEPMFKRIHDKVKKIHAEKITKYGVLK